jgi:hypothetical protein
VVRLLVTQHQLQISLLAVDPKNAVLWVESEVLELVVSVYNNADVFAVFKEPAAET